MRYLLAARNRWMRKKMEQRRSTPIPEEGGLICSEESDWNVRIPFSQNDSFFSSSRRKREEERNGADSDWVRFAVIYIRRARHITATDGFTRR